MGHFPPGVREDQSPSLGVREDMSTSPGVKEDMSPSPGVREDGLWLLYQCTQQLKLVPFPASVMALEAGMQPHSNQ